jgi:hypothetical protein
MIGKFRIPKEPVSHFVISFSSSSLFQISDSDRIFIRWCLGAVNVLEGFLLKLKG